MSRKLYYSDASPFRRVVRILLQELDVPFESDQLNQLRPIDEFASRNPGITIPVFEDDQLVLFDSKVITQYLLETFAESPPSGSETFPLLPYWVRDQNKWEDLKLLSALETLTET